MSRQSAGILLFRRGARDVDGTPVLEVLIVHPGGPFFARRDAGVWSIPKGEFVDETPLAAAFREFEEEVGSPVPGGPVIELGSVVQAGRKRVTAFAVEGDLDLATFRSNTFELMWPPGSGRRQEFPECDRAEWVTPARARTQLVSAQAEFVDRLLAACSDPAG